ncbi:DUF3861 family protein [Pseudoxanthomonas suwonensis]|uniref:DUF3861 family protein n=1 Tax=Pseudoxanthomonas suwonensis TaxID=314722 RepID=UPI0004665881|nr:DUF3861 family protein [Pseudoxanthomonas suwonensis]
MASTPKRYRVTVTPVERDGLPCSGRCSIEFDQACGEDWMRMIENTQRLPGYSGDERIALVVGARLLDALARTRRDIPDDPLAELRAPLEKLLARISPRTA